MIKYQPVKDKRSSYLSLILLIGGLVVFMLSGSFKLAPFITQLIAIAMIVLSVQIMQRYVLSEFTYIIDDKDDGESLLSVIRTQGKKSVTVCSVSLNECIYAGNSEKFDMKLNNSFDYRQNVFEESKFAIVYLDGSDNIMIKLELDDYTRDCIAQRINNKEK